MRRKTDPLVVWSLLLLVAGLLLLAGCTVNRDKVGRIAEDLASTAEAEGRERAPTIVAGAKDLGSTAVVEMGERAPTVGVGAATAAQKFSRELQTSDVCTGAAGAMLTGGLALALIRHRSD